MDYQDIRTLKILEAIEKGPRLSQRDLSDRLNISLGLVNSFLKRLAKKGYFKVTTVPKNRVKYMLTPKGMVEKTRLTYEYIQYSLQFYVDARKKIKRTLKNLEEGGTQEIVFFGTSDLAEITYVSLQETPLKLTAVVDDQTQGIMFLGHRVQASDALQRIAYDKILITAITDSENPVDMLIKKDVDKKKITLIQ